MCKAFATDFASENFILGILISLTVLNPLRLLNSKYVKDRVYQLTLL